MSSYDLGSALMLAVLLLCAGSWIAVRSVRRRRIRNARCSFCGRPREDVDRMIEGREAFICDDCVLGCVRALGEEKTDATPQSPEPDDSELPVN